MGSKQTRESPSVSSSGFMSSVVDYVEVAEKDLPVAKDLLRLCNKISVYDVKNQNNVGKSLPVNSRMTITASNVQNNSGSNILNYHITDMQGEEDELCDDEMKFENKFTRVIHSILTILTQEIESMDDLHNENINPCCCNGNHIASLSCHMFEKEVNLTNFQSLEQFLMSYFGEESPVVTILKMCNQSIIAPAVIALKKELGQTFKYKDSGFWFIDIMINTETGQVTVCHRRKERVTSHTLVFEQQNNKPVESASSPQPAKSQKKTAIPMPKKAEPMRKMYTFEWRLYFDLTPYTLKGLDRLRVELVDKLDFSDSEVVFSESEQLQIEQKFRESVKSVDIRYDDEFQKAVKKRKKATKPSADANR